MYKMLLLPVDIYCNHFPVNIGMLSIVGSQIILFIGGMFKVISDSSYQASQRIAVYLPMPGEVDTTPLIQHMLSANKQCFIPRYHMKSRQMEMLQLYSMDDMYNLPKTKWNIPQPALDDDSREDAMKTGMHRMRKTEIF